MAEGLIVLPIAPDILRLGIFSGIFVVLAFAEHRFPRRPLTVSKWKRWFVNLSIVALDTQLARLVLPVAPLVIANRVHAEGWGLFNLLGLSGLPELAASLLLLDLLIYLQHRIFHRIPLLWRLHRVHHTDLDLDVSSGTRFHPLEIILSLLIKMGAILALGTSPEAVMLFEILLNATAMFSHADLRLPLKLDHWLRLLVVTPDMHRVHHSIHPAETDTNFGFNLPWWDRLLGTYCAQPSEGHDKMQIGLRGFRDQAQLGLRHLLTMPFSHYRVRSNV